jgi:hypothetical protein
MGMTFKGPAEQDLNEMLEMLPREFTTEMVVEATGWDIKKARQAVVMGLSQDRLMPREIAGTSYRIYENVAWRREWVTKRWAA